MIHGKSLIAGQYSQSSEPAFNAFDPASLSVLEPAFVPANTGDANLAVQEAGAAWHQSPDIPAANRAAMLEALASEIEKQGELIISRAMLETGLPQTRLQGELVRTTSQLRMFSRLVESGQWLEASVNHGDPDRQPAPRPDLRRMRVAIGPVVIFGASNFPLAFSVAGGDTASALAAGNPVIVKAHPSHPGTSELVGECIKSALSKSGFHPGFFSLLHDSGFGIGQYLVSHPGVKAAGFTGSLQGGKALFDLAMARPEPIPFFAEMGSVNPVILLPGAQQEAAEKWAAAYGASLNLGAGQFCTNPGLLFVVSDPATKLFLDKLAEQIQAAPDQVMLTEKIAANFHQQAESKLAKIPTLAAAPESTGLRSRALIGVTTARHFIENPDLAEEVFGPFAIVIQCTSEAELLEALGYLSGQLTASLLGTTAELAGQHELIRTLQAKVGRLIFNGLPTGVEVNESMQHGGPFPASSDSRFTSVGTGAVQRFSRPMAWQDCPDHLLPAELQENNPLRIPRLVDGRLMVP